MREATHELLPAGDPGAARGPTDLGDLGGPGDLTDARTQQDLLSRTALGVFRLNGQFLAISEELAKPAGLTAAWWQVLGAVLREPLPVAGIARNMGITRQSVQRIADLLVAKGLAEYAPNPAHRRAKLLRPTEDGRGAVDRIGPGHAALAARLTAELGDAAFAETVRALERLATALDALESATPSTAVSASAPE
ncbi:MULTISPECIES: MarR family winged helix-turn-helix transcriptional regulator [unclassified Streptomyces]|uniref:MarR family winged helix-turn-helix transcriptional regulator n=1 Tax=unclassified Streptomyces TaxID=2593676 RepID=UPI002E2C8821|nr:MarR family winged helix-turn-helix transcriptional regulator [Streptomyces sp. NBC_01439]